MEAINSDLISLKMKKNKSNPSSELVAIEIF